MPALPVHASQQVVIPHVHAPHKELLRVRHHDLVVHAVLPELAGEAFEVPELVSLNDVLRAEGPLKIAVGACKNETPFVRQRHFRILLF